jgi:iron complex transport system substrate-binding protein
MLAIALCVSLLFSLAGCKEAQTTTLTKTTTSTTTQLSTITNNSTITSTITQTNTVTNTTTQTSTVTETTTAEPATKIFTDSLGRSVEIPTNITKVALSGPLSQIVLFALCPDKLVGLATAFDASAEAFFDPKYYNLPILGQLYGGKGTLNLEVIAATGAEIIIDVGEQKTNMAADLDTLQEQIGIPFVHIDGYTAGMGDCYRTLGDLLGMEDEAEVIADYCDEVYAKTLAIVEAVGEGNKVKMLYCTGDAGLNVIAKGSYHAEIIDLLCDNLAVVDNPSSKGTGNEVDLEQIMLWNPDVIIFSTNCIFSTVGDNPDWATITAIANDAYYEAPYGPYNWMGFPPSVQRYLGMIWMAQLLYPDIAQYDVYAEVSEYFNLFYHCNITQEQYDALVANSLGIQ